MYMRVTVKLLPDQRFRTSEEEAMRRELHCFIVGDVTAPRRDPRRPQAIVAVVFFLSAFTTSQTQNLKLEA
jgi:hypothetical protein